MFSTIKGDSLILEAPQNMSVGIGNMVNISCRGNGRIIWVIDGVQVREQRDVNIFITDRNIIAEAGQMDVSKVVIIGSVRNNGTEVICRVESIDIFGPFEQSPPTYLLVYGKLFLSLSN